MTNDSPIAACWVFRITRTPLGDGYFQIATRLLVRFIVAKHGTQNFQKVPSLTAHLFNLSLPNRGVHTALVLYTIRGCVKLFVALAVSYVCC